MSSSPPIGSPKIPTSSTLSNELSVELTTLTKKPNIEIRSYIGPTILKGGMFLQKASETLTTLLENSHIISTPEQKKAQEDTKQQEKVEAAKTAIESSTTNLYTKLNLMGLKLDAESLALHDAMKHGQNLRTRAVFFNTALAVIGGAAGCFAGMTLSHLGGIAGAVAGAFGGALVGSVAGHVFGKDLAEYMLKGMGVKEGEHEAVRLLVTVGFGAIGAIIGFGAGLGIGGAVGGFLGEVCTVGGFTKGGLALGWLLGAATVGGYLDAHGKAYEEAVKDKMKEEDFEYKGSAVAPSFMDQAAEALRNLQTPALKETNVASSNTAILVTTQPDQFITNMNKLLGVDQVNQTPSTVSTDTEKSVSGGRAIQNLDSTHKSIFETLVTLPSHTLNEWCKTKEEKTKEVRDARQTRYDHSLGADTRLENGITEDSKTGNVGLYRAGVAISGTAIFGRVMADLAGISGGLVLGAHALVLSSPIIAASALASAAGGFVEGGIVGFAGGYLLVEWLSGKSSVKNLIELEYKQDPNNQETIKDPHFKNSPEYKEFEKAKMALYNKDQTAYDKAKDAVWTGVAISMGVVGAIIGAAGCCILKGALHTFVVKAAILGGTVKLSMIVADNVFGAPLHHLYCLGSSLEKANVPIDEKFVNMEGTTKDSPSSIISISKFTKAIV